MGASDTFDAPGRSYAASAHTIALAGPPVVGLNSVPSTRAERRPAQRQRAARHSFPTVELDCLLGAGEAATGNPLYVQVVVELDSRLDEDVLEQAVQGTVERNPYFGCRFQRGLWQPRWRTANNPAPQLLEIREITNEKSGLQDALAAPLDPQRDCAVKVLLLRGGSDTLCIKLDHKLGDGFSALEFAYELAESYSAPAPRNGADPPVRVRGSRSLRQVLDGMSPQERHVAMETVRRAAKVVDVASAWQLPQPDPHAQSQTPEFLIERFDREAFTAIFRYAIGQRATVNQVLSAAFGIAALRSMPRMDEAVPHYNQTVDLRRYLPSKRTDVPCNLVGMCPLAIRHGEAEPFHLHVASVRDQVAQARKGFFGLSSPMMQWAFTPWRRCLFSLLPYRILERGARRRERRARTSARGTYLVFTDIGRIDPLRLRFGVCRPTAAFIASGVVMSSRLALFCATEFDGTLTVCAGVCPTVVSPDAMLKLMQTFRRVVEMETAAPSA